MVPKLPAHEWLIIVLLITALLLLSLVTLIWRRDKLPPIEAQHELTTELVQVTVQGAVERTGVFEMRKGCKFKELWELCRPLPDANLTRFKPNQFIRDGQVVIVPLKEYITVYLKGAVTPQGALRVMKGMQVRELKGLVELFPDADREKLNKSRRLKDQETIHIPLKKQMKAKEALISKKKPLLQELRR